MKIKIKISLVLLSCCLLSMVSWADKVQEGIELYKCGLTLPAKQLFGRDLFAYTSIGFCSFLLSARFGDRSGLSSKPGRGRQVDAGRGAIQSRRDI